MHARTSTSSVPPESGRAAIHNLLTSQQMAAYLGCTTRHVFNLRNRGLPAYQIGDLVRFDIDRVKDWLASQEQGSPSPR